MIDRLSFWRVMAWIGAELYGRTVAGDKGSEGWQDKTGAVGVGGEVRISKFTSASHQIARLARFSKIDALLPFRQPSQAQS